VAMRFYTTEKLSAKKWKTPEGFYVFPESPIARIGEQIYTEAEVHLKGDERGLVTIERHEDEVFRPETIASANAKPLISFHHPVDPTNFKELAIGIVLDPRRGKGDLSDYLVADVVVMDADAIEEIDGGKVELSCGYDCDYFQTEPGRGYQKNIIVNHVALVDMARCGSTCRVGDEKFGGNEMSKKNFLESLRCAASKLTGDAKKNIDAILAAAPTEATAMTYDSADEGHKVEQHFHIGGEPGKAGTSTAPGDGAPKWNDAAIEGKFGEMEKKIDDSFKKVMDSIEELKKGKTESEDKASKDAEAEKEKEEKEAKDEMSEEVPPGTGDSAISLTGDSAVLEGSFQQTLATAEIIAPGVQLATFDSKAKPTVTLKAVTGLRKRALKLGLLDAATCQLTWAIRGREITADGIEKLSSHETRTLFNAVGAAKKVANQAQPARANGAAATADSGKGKIRSITDVNKANAEFWNRQNAR